MPTFAKVSKTENGYRVSEVDAFLEQARAQYSNPSSHILNWRELTRKTFSVEKGGYQTHAVDVAIDKLQDTFAERELRFSGNPQADLRILLLGRINRATGKQFDRVGRFELGYSRKAVERFLKQVHEVLEGGKTLELAEVRKVKFKAQRGGYIEAQVDAFIDRTVEFLQLERFRGTQTGSGDSF